MPDRPGLDDDPYLEEVISLWRQGSAEIDRRLASVQRQITAELANPTAPYVVGRLEAQAARLGELRDQAALVLDESLQRTARYVEGERFAEIYASGARIANASFSFSAPHRAAVEALARDTYADVLGATAHMDEEAKAFVRRVSRSIATAKLTAGDAAAEAARKLRREIEREFRVRALNAVTYRDGSRHSIGEYAEMLMRTKTAQAYNAGTLNTSRLAGIHIFEILDGASCGLTSHYDPELANGLIVDAATANSFPLAHPNCRRAFAPRPDLTASALDVQDRSRSVTTPAQRADQAEWERQLAARRDAAAGRRSGSGSGSGRRRRRPRRPRSRGPTAREQARSDNARRRRKIEAARQKAREAAAERFAEEREVAIGGGPKPSPDVLRRWGVTDGQLRHGRELAKQIKSDVREVARREANDIGGWLADNDLDVISRPDRLRQVMDPATGRRRYVRDQAGYDWLEQLDGPAEARVRRRMVDGNEYRPDVLAEQVRRKTNLDLSDDEAMDWLIDRWLQEDGLRSLASGRVPRYADPTNLLPSEYQLEGYDLARLFGAELDEAAGHVARVQMDAAESYARRVLRPARRGPEPWEMDPLDYVQELEAIEDAARAVDIDGARPGPGFREAMARLEELVPPDIDPTSSLSPIELHERIRLVAQTAGYLAR